MCGSMVDIQSPAAEIKRGIKNRKMERKVVTTGQKYNCLLFHRAAMTSRCIFWPQLCQMLTDFRNHFDSRLAGKFAIKSSLNMQSQLKHVAALPCEMCSKNRHSREKSEANCHARLSRSKQSWKNISLVTSAFKISTVAILLISGAWEHCMESNGINLFATRWGG